jgi:hypothetical protein
VAGKFTLYLGLLSCSTDGILDVRPRMKAPVKIAMAILCLQYSEFRIIDFAIPAGITDLAWNIFPFPIQIVTISIEIYRAGCKASRPYAPMCRIL